MSCPTNKRCYSRQEAVAALDLIVERWNTGTILDPCFAKRGYQCPCGAYHLSKQDPRRFNNTDVFASKVMKVKVSR